MPIRSRGQKLVGAILSVALLAALGGGVRAATWVGSGTSPVSGHALSASAEFQLNGTTLTITLKNTSSQSNGFVPSDGLSALYFDVAGSPNLALTKTGSKAPIAAKIWNGSSFTGPVNLSTYASPSASEAAPYWKLVHSAGALASGVGQHYGIGAAGLGIFGSGVGGMAFTIFPNGFNGSNGNNPVDSGPTVVNYTKFTVTNFSGSINDISNVAFQYGTALNEGRFGGTKNGSNGSVPEPGTLVIWSLLGVVGLAGHRWHRRRAS